MLNVTIGFVIGIVVGIVAVLLWIFCDWFREEKIQEPPNYNPNETIIKKRR